jgi:hypothetical protein
MVQQEHSEVRSGSMNILVVSWDETMIQAGDGEVKGTRRNCRPGAFLLHFLIINYHFLSFSFFF